MLRSRTRYCSFVTIAAATLSAATLWSPDTTADQLMVCGWLSNDVDRCGPWIPPQSGGLTRPHALVFNSNGDLLVASTGTNQVLRYDPVSGAFLGIFVDNVNNGGLASPTDVTFGPDGNLYVCSFGSRKVLRYNGQTGAFIDAFVDTDDNNGLTGPEEAHFGPDGRLYVLSGQQNRVLAFDPTTGAFIEEFISSAGSGLSDPHSFIFGGDGFIYLTSFGNNRVIRFNEADGSFDSILISANLSAPHGITIGPDGDLYICNFNADNVNRFDRSTGAFVETVVISGINAPIDLLFAPTRSEVASLVDFQMIWGTHTGGNLADLEVSDDSYFVSNAQEGLQVNEAWLEETSVGATTTFTKGSTIDLKIETRLNVPGCIGRVRIKNWKSGLFETVHEFPVGQTDQTFEKPGLDATDRIRATDGRIEVAFRKFCVNVPTPFGFFGSDDLLEITVNE